jgi:hypothetical protein
VDLPLRWTVSGIALAMLGLALACCLALWTSEASASHVDCGDTITADTTLDSDLVDCPNNGIVIGADSITLDLNGHTIDGDGTLFEGCDPQQEPCDDGVANNGHDGVTVRHGSVRDFAIGVLVGNARHMRIGDISSSRHLLFGFALFDSGPSLVRNSSGHHNVAPEGDGIGIRVTSPGIQRDPPSRACGQAASR